MKYESRIAKFQDRRSDVVYSRHGLSFVKIPCGPNRAYMGSPHGQKSVWSVAHTVRALMHPPVAVDIMASHQITRKNFKVLKKALKIAETYSKTLRRAIKR